MAALGRAGSLFENCNKIYFLHVVYLSSKIRLFSSYIYIKMFLPTNPPLPCDGRKCLDRTTPYASHEHLSYLLTAYIGNTMM